MTRTRMGNGMMMRRRRRQSPRRRPPEPVPKPEETKEPPAKAKAVGRKPLPKADAARHATHVGEFYENDETTRGRGTRAATILGQARAARRGRGRRREGAARRAVFLPRTFFSYSVRPTTRTNAGGPRSRTTSRRCGAGVWCLTSSFRNGASG